jgi:hypothetical protein
MKRLITSVAAVTILGTSMLFPLVAHAASRHPRASMSVAIVSVSPTLVTAKHATVTFRLRVTGIVLDAVHMGKAHVAGHGHIQLYVDAIPRDAYTHKDLQRHWLASLATTTLTLNLSPAIVGGAGKHRIFAALAQNNNVLYRVPVASFTITVK